MGMSQRILLLLLTGLGVWLSLLEGLLEYGVRRLTRNRRGS